MSNDDSYVKSKSGRFGGKHSWHQTSNDLNEYSNSSGKKNYESSYGSNHLISKSQRQTKKDKGFSLRTSLGPALSNGPARKKAGQNSSLSPAKRGEIKPPIAQTTFSKSVTIQKESFTTMLEPRDMQAVESQDLQTDDRRDNQHLAGRYTPEPPDGLHAKP